MLKTKGSRLSAVAERVEPEILSVHYFQEASSVLTFRTGRPVRKVSTELGPRLDFDFPPKAALLF